MKRQGVLPPHSEHLPPATSVGVPATHGEAGAIGVAVRARGVWRRYGLQWALRRVDLAVPRGATVAVVGANGSGKTTLLKVIATVLRPSRGRVEVNGLDVAKSPNGVRRHVGLLSHHTYLYEELTALENLKFAAAMYGMPDDAAALDRALESVGLSRVRDAPVRTFSSGMRKRLSLARATLHGPDLVLLDEPYGALDSEGLRWVDRFLASLSAAGATAMVATHHVERTLPLCQQVVWLGEGQVRYDGPPEGLPAATRGTAPSWEER